MNHFVTLFNFNYLPQGLAMINSLKSDTKFVIWVICLDKKVFNFLSQKNIENVNLVSIEELEKFIRYDYKKTRNF